MINWGVEKYGSKLYINENPNFNSLTPLIIDIETDEAGNFVGIGMTKDGINIFYQTKIPKIEGYMVTHGGAFDIRQLKSWDIGVNYNNIYCDTKVLAYCYDSTLKSYSLKNLAKIYLGMEYPTYKEIIGTGKKKTTLDKQPINTVANYCGCDVLATYKLWRLLSEKIKPNPKKLFDEIEMPLYRLLARMEDAGVYVDVDKLHQLKDEFISKMDGWRNELRKFGDFNPRSPKQLLEIFKNNKIRVSATNNKILQDYKDLPLIKALLQYRKYKKLVSTYIDPYINSPSLPILHPRFHQSTETGRLASS